MTIFDVVSDLTNDKFGDWANGFIERLENSNSSTEMSAQFMTAFLSIKDSNILTQKAFVLYNELLYGDDELLHQVSLPFAMAYFDYISTAYGFRRDIKSASKIASLSEEMFTLVLPLYTKEEEE